MFLNTHAEITVFYKGVQYEATVPAYNSLKFAKDVDECAAVKHILGNMDIDSMLQIATLMLEKERGFAH